MTPSCPDPAGDRLLELFHHTCIGVSPICSMHAGIIHEIRGRRPPNRWNTPDNRVPVCLCCHSYIHYVVGNTAAIQEQIRQRRDLLMQQLDITWEEIERCFEDEL